MNKRIQEFLLLSKLIKVLSCVLLSIIPVIAQSATVNNYQDCLLFSVKKGLADEANKKNIERACRKQFPDSAPAYSTMAVELDQQAIAKLNLWTRRSASGQIEGTLYNGNADTTLTQIHVILTPKSRQNSVQDFFESEEFELNLVVPPSQTTSFQLPKNIKIKGNFNAKILFVKGY